LVVEGAAESAGRVDVDLGGDQGVGVGHDLDGGIRRGHGGERALRDVGDHDLGAVGDEVLHQVSPDLADAGDADAQPADAGLSPDPFCAGAHALEDAVRGEHRRVTGTAVLDRPAGDVRAFAGDHVHVGGVGSDVTGG